MSIGNSLPLDDLVCKSSIISWQKCDIMTFSPDVPMLHLRLSGHFRRPRADSVWAKSHTSQCGTERRPRARSAGTGESRRWLFYRMNQITTFYSQLKQSRLFSKLHVMRHVIFRWIILCVSCAPHTPLRWTLSTIGRWWWLVYNTLNRDTWQILTIFIGANNLCDACTNGSYAWPPIFAAELDNVLQACAYSIEVNWKHSSLSWSFVA